MACSGSHGRSCTVENGHQETLLSATTLVASCYKSRRSHAPCPLLPLVASNHHLAAPVLWLILSDIIKQNSTIMTSGVEKGRVIVDGAAKWMQRVLSCTSIF
jgi:hypothetical protein